MNIAARSFYFVIATIGVCSCGRAPESFAVPEQQARIEDPQRWERMVRMTDVDARDHFVSDIFDPLAANWRWTGRRPAIRLHAPPDLQRAFRVEFSIPEQGFRVTGPVTLTFLVNGRVLDRRQYAAAGAYEFQKDVPPAWTADGDVTLAVEIDKVLPVPNAPPYGFLMVSIGLKRS